MSYKTDQAIEKITKEALALKNNFATFIEDENIKKLDFQEISMAQNVFVQVAVMFIIMLIGLLCYKKVKFCTQEVLKNEGRKIEFFIIN